MRRKVGDVGCGRWHVKYALPIAIWIMVVWPSFAFADEATPLEIDSTVVLQTPSMEDGPPVAGRRVQDTAPEYEGTEVFHTIYLPPNWSASGPKLPIIFEYTGNFFPAAGSTGRVEGAGLGYGLSGGRFIWVSLPYLSPDRTHNQITWWGDVEATVAYAKANVPRIIKEYHADPDAVLLCGFSRGAIGVNFLGLHDDEISQLWTAFITHDHFDGVRQWRNTDWGTPLDQYRRQAAVRLQRVGKRPYLVSQNGSTEATQDFVRSVLDDVSNFTFHDVRTELALGKFPNEVAIHPHNDRWLCKPSDDRQRTWKWINDVLAKR